MSFLREGPVTLIARLVRSEALINDELVLKNANRVSYEFDTIDARMSASEALNTITDKGDRTRLALLKVLTTAKHFHHLADLGGSFDGQWYRIHLLPRGKKAGPLAWASSLGAAGYEEIVPLVLDQIQYLFSEGDRPLSPVGAETRNERSLAQAIADACKFPQSAVGKSIAARNVLNKVGVPNRLLVRDVGQASFCSAIDGAGNELFHLDAGWPISYNKKTAAGKPTLNVGNIPVILSHWDWDHLHGYHAVAGLEGGTWIVPVQRLGPGAKLVATKLAAAKRLLGVSSDIVAGALRLCRCKGKAGNLNQTGLCVQTTLQSGKTVLYMGDADYDLAPPAIGAPPNFIVATHHGARFSGNMVSPHMTSGRCVVSVGKGNGYGHPSNAAIASHCSAGWSVSYTCERGGWPRGGRHLGP